MIEHYKICVLGPIATEIKFQWFENYVDYIPKDQMMKTELGMELMTKFFEKYNPLGETLSSGVMYGGE